MTSFSKELSFRWSDLDPNFHVRHSAYYDFGAQHRIEILEGLGLTMKVLQAQHFGPILFREECIFRKEIKLSDKIIMRTKISKMKPDASRWSIVHEFLNEEDKLCAIITVDGAWMDTKLRKIAHPTPEIAVEAISLFPKSEDFVSL
ncbi:acyl-CoA thioester hydrolase [Flavobacterium fryxellicola]|jgi:acyl-CoA thioester hydrolase|uniref:Thioesterase n=1 Tax=Flavobacterium fryxellicola TaxID=249352 RepID=A0A162P7J8_9FLAO|nr:acyl-CoA thioesterase [Flavobacterium fryxellicola]OAB29190.1 thioesterase [Flavobacterium fryxellicola]SHN57684.1 acyl-CoA thioester hydrolase [Flavobacterium fryxellicola]